MRICHVAMNYVPHVHHNRLSYVKTHELRKCTQFLCTNIRIG